MSSLSTLNTLTQQILETSANAYGDLYRVCDELYHFLTQVTQTDPDEEQNRDQLLLVSGKAIGLTWAAMCIRDFMRTKKFMDGVHQAVTDLVNNTTDRPVHLFYAGTGPFATLILPLFRNFTSSQIQFSLLEINQQSYDCLRKMTEAFGVGHYIRRLEKGDATSYTLIPDEQIDILLSETMNLGLTKEPQAAIFMNMIPQLQPGTVIIPQKIKLDAALIDMAKRMDHKLGVSDSDNSIFQLGCVFELKRNTVKEHADHFKQAGSIYQFPGTIVSIPAGRTGNDLAILTTVDVYDSIQLLLDESPITSPLKLKTISDPLPAKLQLNYTTGSNPGIKFIELS